VGDTDGIKAVVCQNAELGVADLDDPVPAKGQARLQTLRCGICGSDLHARHGTDDWAEMAVRGGYHRFGRSHEPIVFGHEFCGEVAEYGPGSRTTVATGTPVVAFPLLRKEGHIDPIGLSSHAPGGYAEQLLVQESLMLPVPNGLPPEVATLTEPMAVGWHAVRRAEVKKKTVSVVIGCGPVGLAVVLLLKAQGVRTVIASDFSPARRDLARRCGADVVVDPVAGSPYEELAGRDLLEDMPSALELGVGTVEKLQRLPVDWWHLWRLADRLGLAKPKHPVIFECVGVPGVIDQILDGAPLFSRVVVVGVCVGPDTFTPAMAINKEIDLRFVVGYTPLEFRDTLRMLAEGVVDPRPLVTGSVGLEGVDAAFTALADPERHAKILVDPGSKATRPAAVASR
jgi:threonine dehydrogenase-like Zn-dependent dehydrogenase